MDTGGELDSPAPGPPLREVLSSSLDGATRTGPGRPVGRFRFKVPEGTKSGQRLQVQAPDGRYVDFHVPPGCRPGKQVWLEVDSSTNQATMASVENSAAEALQDLEQQVLTIDDAARESRHTLWQRLEDELEIQKALWSSSPASPPPTPASFLQQFIGGALGLSGPISCTSVDEDGLSHTQAMVFAAADSGDTKQLLIALGEARKLSIVSRSLMESAQNLNSAEEAILTCQCLLSALRQRDPHEMEVWLEQAKGLGLAISSDMNTVLDELRRRKDCEQRLQVAVEGWDTELLKQVTAEAERLGIGNTSLAREAAARMYLLASGRAAPRTKSSSPPPQRRPPMSQWEAALNGLGFLGEKANGRGSPGREGPSSLMGKPVGMAEESTGPVPEEIDLLAGGRQAMGPQDPSSDSPFGISAASLGGAGASKAQQRWQDANGWRNRQPASAYPGDTRYPSSSPRTSHRASASPPPSARPESQPPPKTAYSSVKPVGEGLSAWTVRQLLAECKNRGLDIKGCTERQDLVRLLAENGAGNAAPPFVNAAGKGSGKSATFKSPINPPVPPTRSSSTPPTAAEHMEATPNSVWERGKPPSYLLSKRSQALYLLGLDSRPGKRFTVAELRVAYRRAAMECHPDKIQNRSHQEEAKELFQKVKEAFDYLCSPEGGHLS